MTESDYQNRLIAYFKSGLATDAEWNELAYGYRKFYEEYSDSLSGDVNFDPIIGHDGSMLTPS